MTTIERVMLPKQAEFILESDHRYVCYSGCRAGGKSYALCNKLVARAKVPRAREGLFRQNMTDLRNSTLKTLLDGDGEMPPALPLGTYDHNKVEGVINIHGGGEILYGGFDKGIAARQMGGTGSKSSMNLTGAAIDEAIEVPESMFIQLDGSVRSVVPGLSQQIYVACNPGPPANWVARKFGLSSEYPDPHDGAWAITTTIYENTFLDPKWVKGYAASMSGVAYDRYIMGKWVGSDGLVYDRFYRSTHVRSEAEEPASVMYAIDPGYTDPFVILEIEIDYDGRMHISREFYRAKSEDRQGVSFQEGLAALREMMRDPDADCVFDSALPALIDDARSMGIRAIPAEKGQGSIVSGINAVQARLTLADDNRPRITVHPDCVSTIREFESYEWDRGVSGLKDKPVDADNHAMDALRYAVRHVDGAPQFMFVASGAGEAADREERKAKTFDDLRREDPEWGWE